MKNSRPTIMRASIRTLLVGIALFGGLLGLLPANASAATPQFCAANGLPYDPATQTCQDPSSGGGGGGTSSTDTPSPTDANTNSPTPFKPDACQVDPALHATNCPTASGGKCSKVDANNCDLIALYINPAIRFVTAFVGVAVAIAIIYGGIQIASSGGDPNKAAAGKGKIRNAIFTLVAYFFLYAMLNFFVPGGIH